MSTQPVSEVCLQHAYSMPTQPVSEACLHNPHQKYAYTTFFQKCPYTYSVRSMCQNYAHTTYVQKYAYTTCVKSMPTLPVFRSTQPVSEVCLHDLCQKYAYSMPSQPVSEVCLHNLCQKHAYTTCVRSMPTPPVFRSMTMHNLCSEACLLNLCSEVRLHNLCQKYAYTTCVQNCTNTAY